MTILNLELFFKSKTIFHSFHLTIQIISRHITLFLQTNRPDQTLSNCVRIAIRTWPSILQITITSGFNWPWNSNTGTPMSDSITEFIHRSSFVSTSQPQTITLSTIVIIIINMVKVSFSQSLASLVNMLHTAWNSHGFCGKVTVASSTVPITSHWFWV